MATVDNDTLQLPPPLMAEAKQWAEKDATPIEQFIAEAVAEKIEALKTRQYFEARRERADLQALDRVLAKAGSEPPRPDDALPPDW